MAVHDKDIEGMPLHCLFMRYLMASYLYYEMDMDTPWSDHDFDRACKRLLDHWDTFSHALKFLTDEDALRAGTGHHIWAWPNVVKMCALKWARGD